MFTQDRHRASALHVLGLDPDRVVNTKDLRAAFLRQARKLSRAMRDGTQAPDAACAQASFHAADMTHLVENIRTVPDTPEQRKQIRLERLLAAYRFLQGEDGKRAQYSQSVLPQLDGTLGTLKTESPFANFDARHQQFCFADPSEGPIDDFKNATTNLIGYDRGLKPGSVGEKPQRGEAVEFRLSLSFFEAFRGCTKTIAYARRCRCEACNGTGDGRLVSRRCTSCKGRGQLQLPSSSYVIKRECVSCGGTGKLPLPLCKRCDGTGTIQRQGETAVLHVDPGAVNGTVVKLPGLGNTGRRGGVCGDLVVTLMVGTHRVLHRVQDDFHVAVLVPLSVALLGGRVDVPTADNEKLQIAVPPGATSGQIVSLPQMGAPRAAAPGAFGDLRVHLIVEVPHIDALSKRQRAAVLNFADAEDVVPLSGDVLAAAKDSFRHWLPRRESEV
jgi:DnaJ-class molecular chaperone